MIDVEKLSNDELEEKADKANTYGGSALPYRQEIERRASQRSDESESAPLTPAQEELSDDDPDAEIKAQVEAAKQIIKDNKPVSTWLHRGRVRKDS